MEKGWDERECEMRLARLIGHPKTKSFFSPTACAEEHHRTHTNDPDCTSQTCTFIHDERIQIRIMTQTSTSRSPPVKWAQRKDQLILTIDLQGVKDPSLEVEAGRITFKGEATVRSNFDRSFSSPTTTRPLTTPHAPRPTPHPQSHGTGPDTHTYALDLNLYDEINVDDVKKHQTDRTLRLLIGKKEPGPFWPRLIKEKEKLGYIKTDFDRWVDEDEEDEAPGLADGFDMSSFQQMMGGMGGMGGGGMGGFDMSQLGDLAGAVGDDSDDDEEDIPDLTKE